MKSNLAPQKIKNKKGNLCSICGDNVVKGKGKGKYSHKCISCSRLPKNFIKKTYCEYCGFIAINTIQLDIHHLDGNHKWMEIIKII
jgi:hypothetical protein